MALGIWQTTVKIKRGDCMIKKIGVVLLVVAAAAYGLFEFYGAEDTRQGRGFQRGITNVVIARVYKDDFVDNIEALGTAIANESVDLTASTTDIITEINFSDGMTVKKGHVLVRLARDEEQAALHAAQANFDEQKRELSRIRNLVKSRTLPTVRLDTQKTLYEKAIAERQVALARLHDREIIAPFDGQLGLRRVSAGALLTPGTMVTTLDDLTLIKLDFTVPEGFLSALKVGQTIITRSDTYKNRIFKGIVTTIDSRVNPVSRAVTVRAKIPNPDRALRPGMLLRVNLIKNRTESLLVPEEAILSYGDDKYVFTVSNDNIVTRQKITAGRRRPGEIEIIGGLTEGQAIVVQGTLKIKNGDKINITGEQREGQTP